MADIQHVHQLSPLDLLMPNVYIRVLMVFQPAAPNPETKQGLQQGLQQGLDRLSIQIPWLPGRLYSSVSLQNTRSLEVRSNANDALALVNKGSLCASYEDLASRGMPPEAIPDNIWPTPSMADDALLTKGGVPVFAASLFRFASQEAAGLCVCMHHAAVDATGFSEIMQLWARNVTDSTLILPFSNPVLPSRSERLATALSSDLSNFSTTPRETLLAQHPEYSTTPPTLPTELLPAPCKSKLFRIPIRSIHVLRTLLAKHLPTPPTTNTLLCALLWTTITRIRLRRSPARNNETSRLVTAVNGRSRLSNTSAGSFSTPQNPYLGNAVLYALARQLFQTLATADEDPVHSLAQICASIAHSQSSSTINTQTIAQIYALADSMSDPRGLFPGWDLFGSRDLTITSWADVNLYAADFGDMLGGRVQFVRFPCMEADGVAIVLPRRRGDGDVENEVLDVMIALREDDMNGLEEDGMWRALFFAD